MKVTAVPAAMALALGCVGCISSYKLDEGDFDRYASLHQDTGDLGPSYRPSVSGRKLPGKWTLRRQPARIPSTNELARAADRLKAGAEEIELAVSPADAAALAHILAETRLALEDLAEISDLDRTVDRKRWADGLAAALVRIEAVSRLATLEGAEDQARKGGEPLGMTAPAVLKMVAVYLNERTAGRLLADLGPQDIDPLRSVLAQMALRLGFAAAGRQQPEDLREMVVTEMQGADRPDDLLEPVAKMLLEHVSRAPPDTAGGLAGTLRGVLSYAPKVLKALESFVRQWDRMEAIELEFHRKDDQVTVAATVRVRPNEEVRLDDMVMFQPAIVFRGASRIVVQPKLPGTGETLVAFEPVGDGAVELRFEGLAYGLARLLAMPLASGALREIRVFARTREEGDQVINVTLLMEATGEKGDPRRLLHFQDVRHKRLVRGPFEVRSIVEGTEQVFNYLTPEKRYTFRRIKSPGDE